MKTVLMMVMIVLLLSMSVFAGYTYVVEDGDYFEAKSLTGTQSMLVTGGGYYLALEDYSSATIQSTTPLIEYVGGIWTLNQGGWSNLTFLNGELHELVTHSNSKVTISGGMTFPPKTVPVVIGESA